MGHATCVCSHVSTQEASGANMLPALDLRVYVTSAALPVSDGLLSVLSKFSSGITSPGVCP